MCPAQPSPAQPNLTQPNLAQPSPARGEGHPHQFYLRPKDEVIELDFQHALTRCRPTLTRFAFRQFVYVIILSLKIVLFILGSVRLA